MVLRIALAFFITVGLACSSPPKSVEVEEVFAKAEQTCLLDLIQITSDSLPTFSIQTTPVTVAMFEVFAKAPRGARGSTQSGTANYTTQAEDFGNSGVFDYDSKEWKLVDGAYYKQPFGKTEGEAPDNHPATQVSYYDAMAYCSFYRMRLPTEREWEAAARFKQPEGAVSYPWGDSIKTSKGYRANVWQGLFPYVMEVEDGYAYTSPVDAYPAAPSGLRDMAGNVWEWVSDTIGGVGVPGDDVHRLAKGGSFLCEPNWCHGYLISGSTNNSSETGLFHTGFRCVCEE